MRKRIKKTAIERRSPTFRLIYYWGKFLGINPLTLSYNNKLEFSYLSLFYGCSLGTIHCFIAYRAVTGRFEYSLPNETPIAMITNVIGICCQSMEISLTWFLFAIRQNRIHCLVKSFSEVERLSTRLGIENELDENLRKFGVSLVINNFLYLVSLTISHTLLHYYPNYKSLVWIAFNVPRIASFNAGMLFIFSVLGVRQKFRRLNEKVASLMSDDRPKANATNSQWFLDPMRNSRVETVFIGERIFMVSELHRQLRDVLYSVVEYFAPLLIFGIGNYVSSLPTSVYVLYEGLKDFRRLTGITVMFHMCCISHWTLYPVIVLVVLSAVCGSTSEEANNTGNILHVMLSNCKTIEDIEEFAKFDVLSLDLLKNRVSISLFGLFELDSYFFYGIVATAGTYFTIMVQLYN